MILLSAGSVQIAASLASKWTSLQRLLKWYQNQGNSHITHLSTALKTIWYFNEYISNYMCKNGELSLHSFVVIGHRSWNKTQDFWNKNKGIYLSSIDPIKLYIKQQIYLKLYYLQKRLTLLYVGVLQAIYLQH